MNTLNTSSPLSEDSKKIFTQLKQIAFDWRNKFSTYVEGGKLSMTLPPLEIEQYLATVHEYIPLDQILSPELLASLLEKHSSSSKLPKYMSAGNRVCLTVLPFNFNGNEFSEAELQNGFHLQELIVDQNNIAYSSVSPRGSALFQVMPKQIQDLSFISDGIRENILEEYKKTFLKAQVLFNKPVA